MTASRCALRAKSLLPLVVTTEVSGPSALDTYPLVRRGREVLRVLGRVFMPFRAVRLVRVVIPTGTISIRRVFFRGAPSQVFDSVVRVHPVQMSNLCRWERLLTEIGKSDESVNGLRGATSVVPTNDDSQIPLLVRKGLHPVALFVSAPGVDPSVSGYLVACKSRYRRPVVHDSQTTLRRD